MNVNANSKAALRQVMMQTVMRSAIAAKGAEAEPLLGDADLVVETLAAESAVKRFTRTEDERRQDRRRDIRNKADKKKQLERKELAKKRDAAQESEMEHLEKEFAANLVFKA